jgi:hypothetical protein
MDSRHSRWFAFIDGVIQVTALHANNVLLGLALQAD